MQTEADAEFVARATAIFERSYQTDAVCNELRNEIRGILASVSSGFAVVLYRCVLQLTVFCKDEQDEHTHDAERAASFVQRLSDAHGVPFDQWLGAEVNLTHFVSKWVDVGELVDWITDAMELSPDARARQWKQADAKRAGARASQCRARDEHAEHLRAMRWCREQNERAYTLVMHHAKRLPGEPHWSRVLQRTDSELRAWSACDWGCVSLDTLHPVLRRAVVHRVQRYADAGDSGPLPASMRDRLTWATRQLAHAVDADEAQVAQALSELRALSRRGPPERPAQRYGVRARIGQLIGALLRVFERTT